MNKRLIPWLRKTMPPIALLAMAVSMTGCASWNQAYSAYGAAALNGAQGAEDNVIKTWTVAACATPLSAIVRNPGIVPALEALCVPGGQAANTATMMATIPAATPTISGVK